MPTARDIMSTDIIMIRGSATVAEAIGVMKQQNIRSLLVERRNEHDAYGIVTETDIVYRVIAQGKSLESVQVHEIMTKPCIIINPDLDVEYVARLFSNTGIRRAPVVERGLIGIVTVTDILHKAV